MDVYGLKLRCSPGEGVGGEGNEPGREKTSGFLALSTMVLCLSFLPAPKPPYRELCASVKFSVPASKVNKQRLRRGTRGLSVSIF